MDENNAYSGQTTQGNTISEDDGSYYSFSWLRENPKRRKSRLGTRHRNNTRTLQDLDLNIADNLIQDTNSCPLKENDPSPLISSLRSPSDELIVPVSPDNQVQKKFKNETSEIKSPTGGILKKRFSSALYPDKLNFELRANPQTHFRFLNVPAVDSIVETLSASPPIDELDNPVDELDRITPLLPSIQDISIENKPPLLSPPRTKNKLSPSILHYNNEVLLPSPLLTNKPLLSTSLIKKERLPSPPPPPKLAAKPTVRFVEPIMANVRRETIEPIQYPVVTKSEVPFVEPLPISFQSVNKLSQHIKVRDKTYKINKILGKGGSSVVYEVLQLETNEVFAMKKVKLSNVEESVASDYLNEVALLQNLQNCDIIVKIYDHEYVCDNGKKVLYMVMEKGQADLSNSIREISQQSADTCMLTVLSYWCQMLKAVNEVHKRSIVHSDLKPQNFLWVGNKLKLIDFGIAAVVQEDKTSVYKDMFSGTLNYICPEAMVWKEEGYRTNFKRDVWALGCILYSLIYGYTPFGKLTKEEKKRAVRSPEEYLKFPEKEDVPVCLMTSLKACLRINPDERPSISELIDILYCKNK